MKYKYVSVNNYKRLNLSSFPSAGPNPNIKGMREKCWGKNAYIIKCSNYAYKVDYNTFLKA